MKSYITLGMFNFKYFLYCVLYIIVEIYLLIFIYGNASENNIIEKHHFLDSLFLFSGYLLNFIPEWISNKKSNSKKKSEKKGVSNLSIDYIYNTPYDKNLSIKDIAKFCFVCLILLLLQFIKIVSSPPDTNNKEDNQIDYDDEFPFIDFLIIYLFSKYNNQAYYKHQNISFLIFSLVEIIKIIYIFINNKISGKAFDILEFIFEIINRILLSSYFLCIKEIMKNDFISPYKCNYIIGIINFPLIIIIYFIISFTSYFKKNIFSQLIKDLGEINIINVIRLVTLPLGNGIMAFLVSKTIYDFTIYHLYVPLLLENIIYDIFIIEKLNLKIFLISCFCVEFIMILVFLEIIELHFCDLDKNLKKNIESRGIIDSSLAIEEEDDYDDEIDNERNIINNETKK